MACFVAREGLAVGRGGSFGTVAGLAILLPCFAAERGHVVCFIMVTDLASRDFLSCVMECTVSCLPHGGDGAGVAALTCSMV